MFIARECKYYFLKIETRFILKNLGVLCYLSLSSSSILFKITIFVFKKINGYNNLNEHQNGCYIPENGYNNTKNKKHFALINFPNNEGVLLHQSSIQLRAYSNSKIRLAWRVSEGEELLDADGIDDNILQVICSDGI